MTPKQITTPLAEMRKAAGYSSARSFAVELDIAPSTYARYEQSAENIPTKQLSVLADRLGCTTDEILGRTEVTSDVSRGPIQKAFDELSPEKQQTIVDFIDFLSEKEEQAKRLREEEIFQANVRYVHRYELELSQKAGSHKDLEDILVFGTADEKQQAFLDFVSMKAADLREQAWQDEAMDFHNDAVEECGFYLTPDENGISHFVHSYDDDYREQERAEEKRRISQCIRGCIERDIKTMLSIMEAYRYVHPEVEHEITAEELRKLFEKQEEKHLI